MGFTDNVRFLRESKGLTQRELAAKVGISVHTLQSWETGRRDVTVVLAIRKLAKLFSVTADELLADKKPRVPKKPSKKGRRQ